MVSENQKMQVNLQSARGLMRDGVKCEFYWGGKIDYEQFARDIFKKFLANFLLIFTE